MSSGSLGQGFYSVGIGVALAKKKLDGDSSLVYNTSHGRWENLQEGQIWKH